MKRIASFEINHDLLKPGMYTSRIDGDVVTYDIRMCLPNAGVYLDNDEMHTFEHLFATFARNSELADGVVYVGPMGCRTGFYFLVRDSVTPEQAIDLTKRACAFIADYEGDIPGATPKECGNAAEHSLPKAKALGARMAAVMEGWSVDQLVYEK
ncbi:MAG: S-ribosylhomocysteine lyase [Oscillospiraceae bacterium]